MFHHYLICTILKFIVAHFLYTFFIHISLWFICSHLLFFIGMLSVFLICKNYLYSEGNLLSIICGI